MNGDFDLKLKKIYYTYIVILSVIFVFGNVCFAETVDGNAAPGNENSVSENGAVRDLLRNLIIPEMQVLLRGTVLEDRNLIRKKMTVNPRKLLTQKR